MEISSRTITAATTGRYLVRHAPGGLLLVGFHGYAENAERHLAHLATIPGADGWTLCAVQALHSFYTRQQEVVASWMTRQDREHAIHDNVRYVVSAVAAVEREFGPFTRRVLAGFSQGVAMAYRAAAHLAPPPDGLIGLGGDVPPEVRDRAVALPAVLIGRGTRDEWYTAEKLAADVAALRTRAAGVETVVFDGGHEWHPDFLQASGGFLHTVAASARA